MPPDVGHLQQVTISSTPQKNTYFKLTQYNHFQIVKIISTLNKTKTYFTQSSVPSEKRNQ
jgi:hypothetical protein